MFELEQFDREGKSNRERGLGETEKYHSQSVGVREEKRETEKPRDKRNR